MMSLCLIVIFQNPDPDPDSKASNHQMHISVSCASAKSLLSELLQAHPFRVPQLLGNLPSEKPSSQKQEVPDAH